MEGYNPFKKTAIIRKKLSKPMQVLKDKDLLQGKILDYGCGHGEDVKLLQCESYDIKGFDKFNPVFLDESLLQQTYDIITCNYVFNVIPEISEHEQVLEQLLKLGNEIYISVRTDIKAIKDNWTYIEEYDCWKTGNDSFQRFYNSKEMIEQYFGKVEYIVDNNSLKLFKLI